MQPLPSTNLGPRIQATIQTHADTGMAKAGQPHLESVDSPQQLQPLLLEAADVHLQLRVLLPLQQGVAAA